MGSRLGRRVIHFANLPIKLLMPSPPFDSIREIALKTIPSATKVEIGRVLESLYGFDVAEVRTLNMEGKKIKRGPFLQEGLRHPRLAPLHLSRSLSCTFDPGGAGAHRRRPGEVPAHRRRGRGRRQGPEALARRAPRGGGTGRAWEARQWRWKAEGWWWRRRQTWGGEEGWGGKQVPLEQHAPVVEVLFLFFDWISEEKVCSFCHESSHLSSSL